jgi:hypothetical protein
MLIHAATTVCVWTHRIHPATSLVRPNSPDMWHASKLSISLQKSHQQNIGVIGREIDWLTKKSVTI